MFQATISPSTFNQNFEIAILFNIVERSGNYVFEDESSLPTALRAKAGSYVLGAVGRELSSSKT